MFLLPYWTEIVSRKTRSCDYNDVYVSPLDRDGFTKDQGRTQQVCFHHLQRVWLHEVHGGDENGSDAENEGSDEDDPGDVGILGEMAYQQHRQSEADVVG